MLELLQRRNSEPDILRADVISRISASLDRLLYPYPGYHPQPEQGMTGEMGDRDMFHMGGFATKRIVREQSRFLMRNLVHKDDYEVQKIRDELLHAIAHTCNLPFEEGYVFHSGTEANETALYFAREKTGKNTVLCSNLSHNSIRQAAQKLEMRIVMMDADPNLEDTGYFRFQVDPSRVEKIVTEIGDDLAVIVATMGTTQLGTVEHFADHPAIEQAQRQGTWMHVDAAYGGTILQLTSPHHYRPLLHADSITIDPHKFIGVYGCGLLYCKELQQFEEAKYFSGKHTAFGTTRSAFPAAVALEHAKALGYQGMKLLAEQCVGNAQQFADEVRDAEISTYAPIESGVIPLVFNSTETDLLLKEMKEQGYLLSPLHLSGTNFQSQPYDLHGLRIVVTPKSDLTNSVLHECAEALKQNYEEIRR